MRPYNRIFVTLKQERSDYSGNDRKSLGRCIIEAKDNTGKISVYVQDLKPQTLYKLYIISCRSNQSTGVPLGTISVDARGKGESKLGFDADNVGGSSLPIESFNVVAIMVPSENDIIAPLVGYTENVVIWKNNFWDCSSKEATLQETESQETESQETEPQATELPKESEPQKADIQEAEHQEDVHQEEIHQEEIHQEEVHQENEHQETQAQEADHKGSKPQEAADELREVTLEAAHMAFKDIIHKFNEEIELLENYEYDFQELGDDNEHAQVQAEAYEDTDDLSKLYSSNRRVIPFDKGFQDVDWIEISIKEIIFLDDKYFQYMYAPLVLEGCHRHKHLLLGRRKDEGDGHKYLLGVPSIYSEVDAPIANAISFKRFITCNGDDAEQGSFGYWMLYME